MRWLACGLFVLALSTSAVAQESQFFPYQYLDRRVCGDVAAELGLIGLHRLNLMQGSHYSVRVVTGDWQGVLLVRYAGRSGGDRCWTVHQAIAVEEDLSASEALGAGHCSAPGAPMERSTIPRMLALVKPIEDWASPPECHAVKRAWYLVGSETEEALLVELRPHGMCCGTPAGD